MHGRVRRGGFRPLGLLCALLIVLGMPLALPAQAARDAAVAVIGPAAADELHVMSFNLRFASDTGPNSWSRRRSAMAELLRLEQPTVIGTQEGLYPQLRDIRSDLPSYYDWVGVGRAGGTRDEFTAVFYDTRRLAPAEVHHLWLSDTPDVIGSKSWGNSSIRMLTWVRFTDRRTGTEFVVVNTHLDNQSENSRQRGAALIRDRINALPAGMPVILTGDFNVPAQNSAVYDILTTGAHLTDTWVAATNRRTPQYGTWHNYRPARVNGRRIDWILTRNVRTIPAAAINTFAGNGQLPSDHFPMQTLITLG